MKKFILLTFIAIFYGTNLSQNNSSKLTFIVYSHSVSDSESIFISGSNPLLGNWNPHFAQLEKVNDSTWLRSFNFKIRKNIEYKFTKGSWEYEALNDDGTIPANSQLEIINDTVITIKINRWGQNLTRVIHGQLTGNVKYHLNFTGDGLKPRDIVVWLPPSYDRNSDKRYPVLYMQDGQNVLDPATSSFGNDWRADEIADSLIKAEAINEIIIVAVYNTADRSLEYTYTSLGYTYMDFVVNNLKPFIDDEYRTLPDKENTAIGGSSAGGLISLMIAWNYPEVFSKAACISPAFKIQELNYVDTIANYSGTKKDIKLYIDNGGIGIDSALLSGTNEMIAVLQNKGFKLGKDILWYVDKNAVHSEIDWAKRIWRPLVFFFGKN